MVSKDYFKLKMREYRKNKPKYATKHQFYVVDIKGKKYIFRRKIDINIQKIKRKDIDWTKYIKCY